MKYATAAAFRAALEARFLTLAGRDNDKQLVRFRKMVAYERLLARMAIVAPDQWAIKGGLALEIRFGERSRTTVDLDLATTNSLSALSAYLLDAAALDLGDYFRYLVDRSQPLRLEDQADVERYRITVLLDQRRFEQIVIDVGSGQLPEALDTLSTANLLAFAGFDPVVVPALPLEMQVAEKLHAYTREYSSGRQSSRVKDLIDLVLIASLASFEEATLSAAILETFAQRGTQQVPARFPPPPDHWRIPYATLARDVDLAERLDEGFAAATAFLDPVLDDQGSQSRTWVPGRFEWS